jgi:hypothetical protein
MTEKKPNVITINDKEYTEEQLTDDQKVLINHITDLDRKIGRSDVRHLCPCLKPH